MQAFHGKHKHFWRYFIAHFNGFLFNRSFFGIEFALRGRSVTFTYKIFTLRRTFFILKWAFISLLFLLALVCIFALVFPRVPSWLAYTILAGWVAAWFLVFRKWRKKLGFLAGLILFSGLLWGLIHLPIVQNWLISTVASRLSESLHTKVEVKHIDFSLFNKMNIKGVMVEDLSKDTLLYAGEANVKVTDWFFLKDKAVLHYISLDDAVINMKRTDSTWNYQFLVDYFSSPKKDSGSSKKGIEFMLEKAEINHLRFNRIDQWAGKDLRLSAVKINIDADKLAFSDKNIHINSIQLDEPVFSESRYTGRRPVVIKTASTDTASTVNPLPYQWNNGGLVVQVGKFEIRNGKMIIEKETDREHYTDRFDGQHMLFSNISGNLKDIHFEKDTLNSRILFSANEKSGLNLKKLDAQLKFTPSMMEFSDMVLEINNSLLKNYYAMKYNDFTGDMGDFIHAVTLEGRFENSKVNSDDIAIFAPAVKSWKKTFDINGTVTGKIDNLVSKKILVKSGNTIIDGSLALRGLPDLKETFIDYKGDNLQTDYNDLISIVPSLKNTKGIQLARLGTIRYKGNFTGFINDFVTYGTFNTTLGTVTGDLNMKLPEGKPAQYSGKLSTGGFDLGKFTGNSQLGNIAIDGKITGSGFSQKELKANFKGNSRIFYLAGNTYQNISMDAHFENKLFTGSGAINDPNLKITGFKGTLNFNKAQPEFNFDAKVEEADLQRLKLTKEDFHLSGDFNLNFTGKNIDDFLGDAIISGASLKHNGKSLSFDSLTLHSRLLEDNKKQLTITSNEANATITGNYKILELPDAFKYFLSNYYPAYINKPSRIPSPQDFDFLIHTNNVDEYTQLIDKKLKGFDNTTISGSLNTKDRSLKLDAKVPSFSYDEKVFSFLDLKARGNADSLYTTLETGSIQIGDSLKFPGATINLSSNKDLTTVAITTSASKTLSKAELNAQVQTYNDGVKIHFFPSSFIINDKKWELEKDGELVIRNSVFDASEVKFVQGEQEIAIATQPSGESNTIDIVVGLKKININDATTLLNVKNPRVEGALTGTIHVFDPFSKKRRIEMDHGFVEKLMLNNEEMGDVSIDSLGLGKDNVLSFVIKNDPNNKQSDFNIHARINLNDSVPGKKIDIALHSKKLSLEILDPYLSGIFSNISGNAESDINFSGNDKDQDLTGTVFITDGSFKVNYTQCKYKFTNQTILFNPGEIDFGNIILKDTLNNTANLTGRLFHNIFKDFRFDNIHMETSRMLLMNTTKRDNSAFYGKIIGNADMNIDGPISNLQMRIDGGPSTILKDSNHLYLPTASSRDAGNLDYMEFVQFGNVMENELNTKEGTNIVVDMNLKANPACKVDVILDESTSDIIKGQGSGQLHIKVGNKEDLSIRGTYVIESGEYVFNFKEFLQKGFSLRSGSYITWDKPNPYDAKINIDAEYLATKIDFSSLPSLRGNTSKSNIRIVSHLTNTLQSPKISFEFELPPDSYYAQDLLVKSKLADYANDANEMNKQVSSILIFNSFSSQSIFKNQNASGLAINTIGQIIFRDLTDFFNKYLQQLGLTLNFDVSSSNNDLNGLNRNLQAAANFGITTKIANGRIIISVGGNLDYNNPFATSSKNKVLLTPDFTAEFLLNKDGKLRMVAFRKTNTDFSFGQQTRQGLRLSYRKDF